MRTFPVGRYPCVGVMFPSVLVSIRSPSHRARLERYELAVVVVMLTGCAVMLAASVAAVAWSFTL